MHASSNNTPWKPSPTHLELAILDVLRAQEATRQQPAVDNHHLGHVEDDQRRVCQVLGCLTTTMADVEVNGGARVCARAKKTACATYCCVTDTEQR